METFLALLNLITAATAEYLIVQIDAGAEVVTLFDSWAGALPGPMFERVAFQPAQEIIVAIRAKHPKVPSLIFRAERG